MLLRSNEEKEARNGRARYQPPALNIDALRCFNYFTLAHAHVTGVIGRCAPAFSWAEMSALGSTPQVVCTRASSSHDLSGHRSPTSCKEQGDSKVFRKKNKNTTNPRGYATSSRHESTWTTRQYFAGCGVFCPSREAFSRQRRQSNAATNTCRTVRRRSTYVCTRQANSRHQRRITLLLFCTTHGDVGYRTSVWNQRSRPWLLMPFRVVH